MNWFRRFFTRQTLFLGFTNSDKRRMLDWNMVVLLAEKERRRGTLTVIDLTRADSLTQRLSDAELDRLIKIRRLFSRADATSGTEAIALYKQVAALAPWDEICLMTIGVEYAQMRRFDQAMPWLEKAFALNPENTRVRSNLENIAAAARRG